MKDLVIQQCRLCLQKKELRFSHIIPNLFFRKLKHENKSGQIIYFYMEGEGKIERGQNTWQEYLLCEDCEAKIEKYETYASRLLYYPKGDDIRHVNTKDKRILQGIEPTQFKLFQLSVLWRAGISSLPMFSRIVLTKDEQEFLRKILHDESVWLYEQYWCDIVTYYDKYKRLKDSMQLIIQPTIEIKEGRIYYIFVFGGYVWNFNMSNAVNNLLKVQHFREEGKYIILKYEMFRVPVIRETIKKAAMMGLLGQSKTRMWQRRS